MRRLTLTIAIFAALMFGSASAAKTPHHHHYHKHHTYTVKQYARKAAASEHYRWTGAEWEAIDMIVTPESNWNPCAYNPSHSDCHYVGSASCGLPQAQPCPWSGDLWHSRFRQVWWMLHYIKTRYGDPLHALAFRRVHNWY